MKQPWFIRLIEHIRTVHRENKVLSSMGRMGKKASWAMNYDLDYTWYYRLLAFFRIIKGRTG